jgi:hypothetical protein
MNRNPGDAIPKNLIKVSADANPIKQIEYGKYLLQEQNFRDVRIIGSG